MATLGILLLLIEPNKVYRTAHSHNYIKQHLL